MPKKNDPLFRLSWEGSCSNGHHPGQQFFSTEEEAIRHPDQGGRSIIDTVPFPKSREDLIALLNKTAR